MDDFHLPHAGGLERELLSRVTDGTLSVSSHPKETLTNLATSDGIRTIAQHDIYINWNNRGEKIGTFTLSTYNLGRTERVEEVSFRGRIPDYNGGLRSKEEIRMRATGYIPIPIHPVESNNTSKNPLCRHDKHKLDFATHEYRVGGVYI